MSIEDKIVSFSLEINVEKADANLRKLYASLYRSLGLVKRLSGNERVDYLIDTMQQAITIANRLRLALYALQAARIASGDPLAWALAGISVVEVGVDISTELTAH